MVIILYQFNYNIEKTQWTDQTSCETKNNNKIFQFYHELVNINFYICSPLSLSENWQKNTAWLTLRLDLKKHEKWTWLLSGHPDGTGLVNNAFYTFNLIQGILSASFAWSAIHSSTGFPRSEVLTLWYQSVQRTFSGFVNIHRSFIENYNWRTWRRNFLRNMLYSLLEVLPPCIRAVLGDFSEFSFHICLSPTIDNFMFFCWQVSVFDL